MRTSDCDAEHGVEEVEKHRLLRRLNKSILDYLDEGEELDNTGSRQQ